MMRLSRWVLLGLASLMLVGCVGEATKNQAVETTPAPTSVSEQSTQPAVVKSGSFASGEHSTQGKVRIMTQNGKSFLELDQEFKTSDMGPDLVVILHRSSDVLGSTQAPSYPLNSGDYVLLAPLQKFSGAQRYDIPANVNLASYKSAAIWCRKFNATFGAAKLVSQ